MEGLQLLIYYCYFHSIVLEAKLMHSFLFIFIFYSPIPFSKTPYSSIYTHFLSLIILLQPFSYTQVWTRIFHVCPHLNDETRFLL